MDNHPIPQDITGFKFKLIGKMTIRQFIYVAIGGVIAWVVFFIIEPPTLIKWPIAIISLGVSAFIAFVPIDGRPMDTMLKNFLTAILSPTQYIYQKEVKAEVKAEAPVVKVQGPSTWAIPAPQEEPSTPPPAPAQPEEIKIQTAPVQEGPPPILFPDPTAMPAGFLDELNKNLKSKKPEENTKKIDEKEKLKKQIAELQKQLEEKSKKPTPPPAPVTQPVVQVKTVSAEEQKNLEKKLSESMQQKEALEKQIIEMKAKQEDQSKQTYTPVTATQQKTTQRVRKVPVDMASSIGIPGVPDTPNLITGIIKDPRGNPVSNILVEIKDLDSNPVRAFKTNKLGKFASATPLSNGKYVISFEDPGEKHKFDDIEMEMVGSVVMPLEVISVDPREELRRELFN